MNKLCFTLTTLLILHVAAVRAHMETAAPSPEPHGTAAPLTPQRTRQGGSLAARDFLAREDEEGWELYLDKWIPQFWLRCCTSCLLCSWHS